MKPTTITITIDISADDMTFLEDCRAAVYQATKHAGGFTDAEMPEWSRELDTFLPTALRGALPGVIQMFRQLGRDGAVAMIQQMMEQVEELKIDRKANRQN